MALPTPTPPGFCDATVTFEIPNPVPDILAQVFFNITAPNLLIADPIVVGAITDVNLQAFIEANPAYLNFVAMGGSINIVSVSAPVMGVSTVVAVIRKPITLPQTMGEGHYQNNVPEFVSFICVPVRKKRKRVLSGIIPYIDVAFSVGENPARAVIYEGNLFVNPVLRVVAIGRDGTNVYRYTNVTFLNPMEQMKIQNVLSSLKSTPTKQRGFVLLY